jgi:phage terminase small subunit
MGALKNARHERFCREYVIDLNATQAYIRAGYSVNGAGQSAEKLLRNTEIIARIAELQAKVTQRLEITQESVLKEIEETRIAAAQADQHSVALKAAELKGRHIGMWPNKVEANVNVVENLNADEQRALRSALEAIARDKGEDAEGPPRTHH